MDANRLQLAAALQARDGQQGGQMAQKGYGQRPGIPTRTGMPQPMQGLPPQAAQQVNQALSAMRGPQTMPAAPQFGFTAPAPGRTGKPGMGAGKSMPPTAVPDFFA